MAYKALYRRFRPERFEDVSAQEHITTTLKNQVATGTFSHAYLFSGSRGTGKTSTAKIFARAINCLSPVNGEPCGKCQVCLKEDNVDIIEIDAASNNGVDEIRDLREKSRFLPLNSKFKVYIIDEVHMLSPGAFNALLKTLEEPPAHVVFILATTEPQKLPATIVSRCQRFEFKRISASDIAQKLNVILEKLNVSVESAGIETIALSADGSLRDALSLLDQCLAFCADTVTYNDVLSVLGSMSRAFLFDFTDTLIVGDAGGAIDLFASVVASGKDIGVFLRDLVSHLRNLLMVAFSKNDSALIECTSDTLERYRTQAGSAQAELLLRALSLLMNAESQLKYISSARVLVESTLVRICRPEDEKSFEALIERISKLEKALENGAVPAPKPAAAKPAVPPTPTAAEARPAATKPTPPAHSEPMPDQDDLWESVLLKLQSDNIMVYNAVKGCTNVTHTTGTLFACFPAGSIYASNATLTKPYEELINKLMPPGITFTFRSGKASHTDDGITDSAAELFGDKLTIVDD